MTNHIETLRQTSLANMRKANSEGNMNELYYWNGFSQGLAARASGDEEIQRKREYIQRFIDRPEEAARLRGFEAAIVA